MARKPAPTRAQRLRHHREVMLVALDMGCSLAAAEAEITRRRSHARWLARQNRIAAVNAPPRPASSPCHRQPADEASLSRFWWHD